MTELERVAYAKEFVHKLASGFSPFDGKPIEAESLFNNVRISRCLFFVSDVLRQYLEVRKAPGARTARLTRKQPFEVSQGDIESFVYSTAPVSTARLAKWINRLIDRKRVTKISYTQINLWLANRGYIVFHPEEKGRGYYTPTEKGEELGCIFDTVPTEHGYTVRRILLDRGAQMLVVNNCNEIAKLVF